MDYKLSEKSAKEILQQILDYYEIDINEIDDKEFKKAIKRGMGRLIKAIRLGRLEVIIEEEIKIIQTTKNGEQIEYREIDGQAKVAMGSKEENDIYGRSYAMMGSLCDLGESAIIKLKGVDLSLVEVLGMLFLQV